jgi:hypothetical protein
MAKTNTLRLAAVATAMVAAVLLAAMSSAGAASPSRADVWNSTVNEVTGTITFKYDQEQRDGKGNFSIAHDTVTWPATFKANAGDFPHWIANGPAKVTVQNEQQNVDGNGTPTEHSKWYGTPTAAFAGGMAVASPAGSWTSSPDAQTRSGEYFSIINPGATGHVWVTAENVLTGETSTVDFHDYVNVTVVPYIKQPLPAAGLTLTGSATSKTDQYNGVNKVIWDLTGTPTQPQIKVTSNKKFISPNEKVIFKAKHTDGTAANANWSGGTPKTGTGTTFTTRFNDSPGFQGQDEAVTAKVGNNTAKGETKVLRESGTSWKTQFPGDNHIAALAQPFQDNVQQFHSALINAGAAVPQNKWAVYRPDQRAHLMYYAHQIGALGMNPKNVPTPFCTRPNHTDGPTYVAWAHYDNSGTYDPAASVDAAKKMLGSNGYQIGQNPVAHPSLHELRRAIDWTITWTGTLNIQWGPKGGPMENKQARSRT